MLALLLLLSHSFFNFLLSAPAKPWTLGPQVDPRQVDAGCFLLRSPSTAPTPPLRQQLPWRWAATLAVMGSSLTLPYRREISQTLWLPWPQKSLTAQLPMVWRMAKRNGTELKTRGSKWRGLTLLGESCRFRRGALIQHRALVEASHTVPLEWLIGPQWSPNGCPYQTLRWGFHSC